MQLSTTCLTKLLPGYICNKHIHKTINYHCTICDSQMQMLMFIKHYCDKIQHTQNCQIYIKDLLTSELHSKLEGSCSECLVKKTKSHVIIFTFTLFFLLFLFRLHWSSSHSSHWCHCSSCHKFGWILHKNISSLTNSDGS